jgi:hypothetical protein
MLIYIKTVFAFLTVTYKLITAYIVGNKGIFIVLAKGVCKVSIVIFYILKQLTAYNAGTTMAYEQNLDWCAFIDIDEFLKIRSDRTLEDILSEFREVP